MKLALYQGLPTDGDEDHAFARITQILTAAAAAGAEMAVFPELFLPGYNRPDLHARLAQPQGGAWETRLADVCRETGCGLTIGWAERAGETVYNVATTYDRSGRKLAHHRKLQLFGPMERDSFFPGDSLTPFDLNGRRAALLICYDVEFAEHVRALSERDVSLLLVPTANPAGFDIVADTLVPGRAAETAMTIAYANYCGTERGLAFGGKSVIAGPDGHPLAKAGRGECLLIADLSQVDHIDRDQLSTQNRDRRPLPQQ
ncbi:carbon-nitrogen hydrolase family protein [Antarctobacter jejuensis]|uniref:carbon-nitrogen hydrolase family protein n=1 Tax=Antarctobacter jejuensis TaxID=1439938 RepID=UPI003FD196B7